jgi:hypothetical protein
MESEIETSIEKFVNDKEYKIIDGIINLGWTNGWGKKQMEIYNSLYPYRIIGTLSISGISSEVLTSFKIQKDEETYVVTYLTDSSD